MMKYCLSHVVLIHIKNLDKLSNQLKSIFNTIKETLGEDYSIDGELVAF